MATDKATIRVVLDTKDATRKLRGLEKDGAATAGRMNRGGGKSGGIGGFGMGAALGAGAGMAIGAARRAGGSTFGAIGGEMTAGIGSRIDLAMGGYEARGKKRSREETVQLYAGAIAHGGASINDALSYARQTRPLRIQEEKAAAELNGALIRSAAEDAGSSEGVLGGLINNIIIAIDKGFDKITTAVDSFGGR